MTFNLYSDDDDGVSITRASGIFPSKLKFARASVVNIEREGNGQVDRRT